MRGAMRLKIALTLVNITPNACVWWRCEERTMHYTNCCSAFNLRTNKNKQDEKFYSK